MQKSTSFIWVKDLDEKNSYAEFYDTFVYKNGRAEVNITVDGDYTLFINGIYVSSSQYGDFEHYKIYDTIDITPYAREGENAIAILAWHFGEDSQRYKKYSAGLAFEVLEDGKIIRSSDSDTLSRKSPTYKSGDNKKISVQLGFSYSYDATKEDGFPFFKPQGLGKSVIIDKRCTLYPRPIKKHILRSEVRAKIIEKTDEYCLFDLGKEYVGYLAFSIEADKECDIVISYGEHLENGRVPRRIGDRDFSITYRAKKGKSIFTNYMLRFACRYLEISSDAPICVDKIAIIPQVYETKRVSSSIKNPLDAKIYDICVNTLELCMMEHYVDCPWREQCLYAFDSRNQMLAGYLAFEDKNASYARSNLLLISKDKREDGILSICYPSGIDLTIPSFSLYYIIALGEYLEHTGDESLILEVDFKIKEIISAMLRNEKNGLLSSFEGANHWNFYDWSPNLSGSLWNNEAAGDDLMLNLLFVYALLSYKKICTCLALPFDYDVKMNTLKKNIKARFFNKEDGLFTLASGEALYHSLPNSLAILLDIVSHEEAQKIVEEIAQGKLISPSLSMKALEYDAFLRVDKAYIDHIKNEIREVYGKMLEAGSTTVWETTLGSADFDGAGSLCHGWSAIAIKYLLI